MSANVLREALTRHPFEPFRVRLSSGDVYEVRHPENALLLRGGVYIALGSDGDLPERAVFCSMLHIAAVETVAAV
jgi:hypothetical protein